MRRKYYYKVMAVLTVVGLTVMSGCGDAKGKEEEAAAVGIETEVIPTIVTATSPPSPSSIFPVYIWEITKLPSSISFTVPSIVLTPSPLISSHTIEFSVSGSRFLFWICKNKRLGNFMR